MKKNTSLNIYLLILFFVVKTTNGFCQTPCITAVNSNNNKRDYFPLNDSGSAVSQNFSPACNGNLSSFSFCYRVLQNDDFNKNISFPVNATGNPIFKVDLNIYELSEGQSIDKTNVYQLKVVYSKPVIEVPILVNNPREDFEYITIPISQSIPLSAAKQYCFVIQLNTAFCDNLIAKKINRNGSYSPPAVGSIITSSSDYYSLDELNPKNICNVQIAGRTDVANQDGYLKYINSKFIRINNPGETIKKYNGYKMEWVPYYSAVFAVNVTPFLPDIQGKNILCPLSRITLTNAVPNGTWTIDALSQNIAILETPNTNVSSVSLRATVPASKGVLTLRYTTPDGNTTTKLIRVVNNEKPIITPSNSNLTACQDNTFTLTGTAVNNKALLLDGKSWAQMPNHPSLGLTNKLTLEAWVYCSDPKAPQNIISKGNDDQEMGNYGLGLFDNKIQFGIQSYSGGLLKSSIAFTNSQWHHVAGTYDGTTMRLYIDGNEVSSLNIQTAMIPNNGSLHIGQLGKNFSYWDNNVRGIIYPNLYRMRGQIDEVRIWNVCRTPQQIKDNMYKTVDANNTGLVGYYKFNEPESITDPRVVIDYSGSQNNGYLYSSAQADYNINPAPNCTAQKVPASISFGDFSYSWSNNATQKTITPTSSGNYSYTVLDSATGCSAKSDAVTVKMNFKESKSKMIPTTTPMPYTYNENGINLTFNDADFTNNVASKPYTSTPPAGTCPTVGTVTITKSDCPNQPIREIGGTARDLSNITICAALPINIDIRGYVNNTDNNALVTPVDWSAPSASDIYVLNVYNNQTSRPEFKALTINQLGTATIRYNYTYQGSIPCSATSTINVSPITVAISTTGTTLTSTASPTLTGTPGGGEWNSLDFTKARMQGNTDNANSSTRTLQYIGAGSVNISYKITTNGSNTCFNPVTAIQAITVQ